MVGPNGLEPSTSSVSSLTGRSVGSLLNLPVSCATCRGCSMGCEVPRITPKRRYAPDGEDEPDSAPPIVPRRKLGRTPGSRGSETVR
jgi:hypothetical protein